MGEGSVFSAPVRQFERSCELPAAAEEAFAWHERPGALARLIPPWERVKVQEAHGGIHPGARVVLVARLGWLRLRWVAEHGEYQPGTVFHDVQRCGPFAHWEHTHRFEGLGPARSRLTDAVTYRLPGGWLGDLLGARFVSAKLDQMFAYRHETTAADLALFARYAEQGLWRIALTGGSGLVGSELAPLLTTSGHQVTQLQRRTLPDGSSDWDASGLAECDAVVHLAGENIGAKRWSRRQKERIRSSRVVGTRHLCERLAQLKRKPRVLVCAAAIGFYGDRGDEWLSETSASGKGYLAEVCQAWEAAVQPARDEGIRVVLLRFGVILSPRGGALAKMLFPFRTGGGGVIGSGKQYWSWISLADAAGAIVHALFTPELAGPVNVVAPEPATNREFTKALGRVLNRPTIIPLPGFAARIVLGEMATEVLLASQRVKPARLQETGFVYRDPELEPALRGMLGRRR